jgi:V8-like Glu-specific endopeptidase
MIERVETETRSSASIAPASTALLSQPSIAASVATTARVADTALFPCCAVGKLFASYGEETFVGSAWTIGNAAILSAGHCVWDAKLGWPDSLLFVPQYADGGGRSWVPVRAAVPKGWIDSTGDAYEYDFSISIASEPIATVTGQLGWLANDPDDAGPFVSFGYPADDVANPEHDGRWMWQSAGGAIANSEFLGAYNDMTRGCSGGPWVVWRDGAVFAKGLNSFRYESESDRMYSPHLGEAFLNLVDWADGQPTTDDREEKE